VWGKKAEPKWEKSKKDQGNRRFGKKAFVVTTYKDWIIYYTRKNYCETEKRIRLKDDLLDHRLRAAGGIL